MIKQQRNEICVLKGAPGRRSKNKAPASSQPAIQPASSPASQVQAETGSHEDPSYTQLMREEDQDDEENDYDSTVSEYGDSSDNESVILCNTMERGTSPTYPEKEKSKVTISDHKQKMNNNKSQSNEESFQPPKHEVRKKKRNLQKRDKAKERKLTGVRQEESIELYARNIKKLPNESLKDIADMVSRYCQKVGVRVMDARTITNKVCKDTVGCKIRIPLRYAEDVLQDRFWPNEVTCRKWAQRPRVERDNVFESQERRGRPSSRSSSANQSSRNRSRSVGSVRSNRSRASSISRHSSSGRSRNYRNAFNDEY